jgi:hypothetical protein
MFSPDVRRGKTLFLDDNFSPYADQWDLLRRIERVPERHIVKALKKLAPQDASPSATETGAGWSPPAMLFPRTKYFPRLPYDPQSLPICA